LAGAIDGLADNDIVGESVDEPVSQSLPEAVDEPATEVPSEVEEPTPTVRIIRIGHRRDVYRRPLP
jgi:hypothetical protein